MQSMTTLTFPGPVVLRRPQPEDLPGLHSVHAEPEAYLFDPQERHVDTEQTAAWAEPIYRHWEEHGFGYWTVLADPSWWPDEARDGSCLVDVGGQTLRVAGMGGVRHFRHAAVDTLNVYYRFSVHARGHGLARIVIDSAQTWAGRELPGTPLLVRTREENSAARHVAERAGFQPWGYDPDDPGSVRLVWPAVPQ